MKNNKKFKSKEDQSAELDGKIQVEGQESAEKSNGNLDVPASDGTGAIKEIDTPKNAINTRQAAEVVTAGSSSLGSSVRKSAPQVSFSGGADQIGSDMSATTRVDRSYKSAQRPERRSDAITRQLDYVEAELFKTKLEQSKPLCETDSKMGYDGNYFNEHAITQRNSGGHPGDPLLERSVDEIDIDMLYWTSGQINTTRTPNLSIRSWDSSLNNGSGGYASPTVIQMGNYVPRALTVEINNAGQIINMSITQTDCRDNISEHVSRVAGDAYLRNFNQSELDRNVMISKAGNESDPAWSALADAVVDVTDQNRLLKMVDTMAGNVVALSTRKLASALSYQINKTAKDGSRIAGPMAEMMNGHVENAVYGGAGSVDENNGYAYSFNRTAYTNGGAGLWLAINESLPKFYSKAKVLSIPTSFRSALAVAESNKDPLVADDLLLSALKHNEMFSTIDGPYDPLKSIVVTDSVGLIHPIPMDVGFSVVDGVMNNVIYVMHYENIRNKYNIRITNLLMTGIYNYIQSRGQRIFDSCKASASDTNPVTIHVPIVSSTTSISLWDLLVCSAVPYIIRERIRSFTEILKYEVNFGYPYSHVTHLKDADIYGCDNYSYTSIDEPLRAGIAKPVSTIKVIMPEVFWPVAKVNGYNMSTNAEGVVAKVVLPHYFSQQQFIYDKSTDVASRGHHAPRMLILSDWESTMSYPSQRVGQNIAFMDTIYGMSEEDYKLSLDRMVTYPGYVEGYSDDNSQIKFGSIDNDHSSIEVMAYKYGATCDGIPVIPYFAYANSSDKAGDTLTIRDIIATPREMGICMVAPAGLLSPVFDANSSFNTFAPNSSYLGLSGPGFKSKLYRANQTADYRVLGAGTVNIDNNASLQNIWSYIYSTPSNANVDRGIVFNINCDDSHFSDHPFTYGGYNPHSVEYDEQTGVYNTTEAQDPVVNITSEAKYYWMRTQRLPFVINPYDCNATSLTSASDITASINSRDIFDYMYFFGFVGMRASNYKALTYERNKLRIAKGMNYVSDPYTEKSFLLK